MKLRRRRNKRSTDAIAAQLRPRNLAQVRPLAKEVTPGPAATVEHNPEPAKPAEPRLVIRTEGQTVQVEPRILGDKPSRNHQPTPPPVDPTRGVPRLERSVPKMTPSTPAKLTIKAAATEPQWITREAEWTGVKRRLSWRWTLGIGAAVLLVVVGSLAGVQTLAKLRRDEGVRVIPAHDFEVERIEIDEQSGILAENPLILFDEAKSLLGRYAAAQSENELRAIVRDRRQLPPNLTPWRQLPRFDRHNLTKFLVQGAAEPPFMTIDGVREDFSPFRAYFVLENGQLRLDWKATERFSEIPIDQLPNVAPDQPVTVRCLLKPRPFHTVTLPEDRYCSYLLEDPLTRKFVWGYAERDSPLDHDLKRSQDQTDVAGNRLPSRGTIQLTTPPQRDTKSQFLITTMLNIEWVLP